MNKKSSIQKISVIVPKNPFVQPELQGIKHCLAALNVEKLMEWWPGQPHTPHRDPKKVLEIQRSLDWKRVVQIASYLLQEEIIDAPNKLDKYFRKIYEPKKLEPGREWPPRVQKVVGFERSEYPTFSNVLLHVNGASIEPIKSRVGDTAKLTFDEENKDLHFSVIDGQHRINGAYLAMKIRQEKKPQERWEIPAEIFLDLDKINEPPRHQAQIFIDVNFYQKKVDRSLVADLFPTARGKRGPLDDKERAQDIGRKLMLEIGPLVGMIQIPGIKFGVKDVVTLATLNSAIEDVLESMTTVNINSLEEQTEFLAQCLGAWLEATGRKHNIDISEKLDPSNVAYQGRVLVSFLTLLPACIWILKKDNAVLISDEAKEKLVKWLQGLMKRAGLLEKDKFIAKERFKKKGYLGSGGIGRFRDTLWATTIGMKSVTRLSIEEINQRAEVNKSKVYMQLTQS
ncbi:MAG: DGQHR domain-containing protein [Patescibacteria group bacterium]|nr:DGQHR domain-containing protein [Patescibacteria group bacterium]